MFIDPIIKQPCPRGVNQLHFNILQRLWWDHRYISNYTVQTALTNERPNKFAKLQFIINENI